MFKYRDKKCNSIIFIRVQHDVDACVLKFSPKHENDRDKVCDSN